MEYIDIKKLIDVIRRETKKHANTKERVSKVLDELLDFTKNNYQLVGNYVLQEDLVNYLNSKLNVDGSNIENLEEWKIILNYYDKTETYSKEEIDSLLNVIEVTKSELDILIENSQLKVNSVYKITEIESWYEYYEPTDTVYLTAISNSELSTKGYGEFYVPRYDIEDTFQGIWKGKFLENGIDKDGNLIPESQPDGGQPLEPIYNIGDKVIWGGLVWRNISGDIGNNKYLWYNQDEETEYVFDLHNYLNPEDWELVPVNNDDYYIETCKIEYDYLNDVILHREDKNANILKISNYNIYNSLQYNFQFSISEELIPFANIIKSFQWGIEYIENGCKNNLMLDSIVENCNLVGVFRDNIILNNSSFIQNQFFSISFYENRIENSSAFSYNTINFSHIKNNTILNNSYVNNNVFKYLNTFSNNVINKDSYFRNNIFYPYKGIISNTIERHSGIRDNVIKFDEMSYNTVTNSSSISDNKYYLSIKNNILENSSSINNNDDGNISVNNLNGYIIENTLKNFSKIEYNTFVEEGKTVAYTSKAIEKNELRDNCTISNNTIKNGSRIFGHKLEYLSSINGNTLDTESNIYNNQLIQNGKIDNNILTGHGRIYGNQLDRQSEITLCKLRISPASSYATTMKSNRLFAGKIQNVDFGDIVNPEGTNPNDPDFGGNGLSECIIENNSIIKDLTFPNIASKYIQFVKMNGFSEFKNITVNNSIRNVDFINTIFNETSDYSKLIEGNGLQTYGFTKTYIDGILLQDRFNAETLDVITDRGNTTENDITVGGVTTNYVQIDTDSTNTYNVGKLYWNEQKGTLNVGLYNGVELQLGQEQHSPYAKAYSTVLNGKLAMYKSSEGGHDIFEPADFTQLLARPDTIIGLATHDILTNEFGYITTSGEVNKIDTSMWTEGNTIYFGSGNVLTNVIPTGSYFIIGRVNRSHATQGSISVKIYFVDGTKISGSVTTNYIPKSTASGTIVNSQVQDDGNGIGIGASPSTGVSLYLAKTIGGSTTGRAILATNSISPDVTSQFVYFQSNALTQAGSFTLGSLTHFQASQSTLGAGSSVTTQEGFRVRDNLIGATNNYGFRGQIPAGTNRWNLYMDGTANNYLAGNLAIGTISPNSTDKVHIASSTTKASLRLQSTEATSSSEINLQSVGGSAKFELDYAGNVVFRTLQSSLFFDNFSTTGSINFRTNGSNSRMTIDKDGNIGIGTTAPLRLLHIAGIARASTFTADRFAQDGLQVSSYFAPGTTSTLSSQNNLTIQTVNSNTDVIITPTRNVGVGTTSPTEKLDVNGNVLVQGLLKLKPQTSAPTGVEGAIYYDSTTKKHYGFDGTTWNALY